MSVKDFVGRDDIQRLVQDLKKECEGKPFSDIIDDANHQYIDLVMEGGGVLGIALVGYTYVLEEIGLRFLGIGGTSAGSINALVLAGLDTPDQSKTSRITELLAELPMRDFIDGDHDAKELINAWLEGAGKIKLGFRALQVIDNFTEDLGLNPGQVFQAYISGILSEADIKTTQDLKQQLATLPQGLRTRDGKALSVEEAGATLAIVAADVSTETKVEFPKMAPLYWAEPENVDPALYVRASMSIPFFFHPFRVENVPTNDVARKNWEKLASYTEELPSVAVFVDGGTMSNFPIDLFHQPNTIPIAPTFGVKLGSDKRNHHNIETPFQLGTAIFNAARHTLDYDFIARNPDYKHLVAYIDTDDHNWLNFEMDQAEKIDLFTKGARAAADFLRAFDWNNYKTVREQLKQDEQS